MLLSSLFSLSDMHPFFRKKVIMYFFIYRAKSLRDKKFVYLSKGKAIFNAKHAVLGLLDQMPMGSADVRPSPGRVIGEQPYKAQRRIALKSIKDIKLNILASDIDKRNVSKARENAKFFGLEEDIDFLKPGNPDGAARHGDRCQRQTER